MRALGYSAWVRQTVARVEGGKRRLTAEEVFGLALALETRLMGLIEPDPNDGPVVLPSGAELPYLRVHGLFWGGSEVAVTWDGAVPSFPAEDPPPGWVLDYGYEPLPPPRRRTTNPRSNLNLPRYPKPGEQD